MSLFIKIISLYKPIHFLAILYPTSLANLVVEVGTWHSHQILLFSIGMRNNDFGPDFEPLWAVCYLIEARKCFSIFKFIPLNKKVWSSNDQNSHHHVASLSNIQLNCWWLTTTENKMVATLPITSSEAVFIIKHFTFYALILFPLWKTFFCTQPQEGKTEKKRHIFSRTA